MNVQFSLFVSYSQICVFDPNLQNPFCDWTQEHVEQGFAYRPGTVSFRTILEAGQIQLTVEVRDYTGLLTGGVRRAIEVPYSVQEKGAVEIASISEGQALDVPSGLYALRFEDLTAPDAETGICKLTFLRHSKPEPMVLQGDDEVTAQRRYLMEARPA